MKISTQTKKYILISIGVLGLLCLGYAFLETKNPIFLLFVAPFLYGARFFRKKPH